MQQCREVDIGAIYINFGGSDKWIHVTRRRGMRSIHEAIRMGKEFQLKGLRRTGPGRVKVAEDIKKIFVESQWKWDQQEGCWMFSYLEQRKPSNQRWRSVTAFAEKSNDDHEASNDEDLLNDPGESFDMEGLGMVSSQMKESLGGKGTESEQITEWLMKEEEGEDARPPKVASSTIETEETRVEAVEGPHYMGDSSLTEGDCIPKNSSSLSTHLWVSGLASTIRAQDLMSLFSTYGKVLSARIATTAKTPGAKLFGLITMTNVNDANKCIQYLNGSNLHNRSIQIEKAKENSAQVKTLSSSFKTHLSAKPERYRSGVSRMVINEETSKPNRKEGDTSMSEGQEGSNVESDKKGATLESDKKEGDPPKTEERPCSSNMSDSRELTRNMSSLADMNKRDSLLSNVSLSRKKFDDGCGNDQSFGRDRPFPQERGVQGRDRQQTHVQERKAERCRLINWGKRQREEADRLRRERDMLMKEREQFEKKKAMLLRQEREIFEREKDELSRQRVKHEEVLRDLIRGSHSPKEFGERTAHSLSSFSPPKSPSTYLDRRPNCSPDRIRNRELDRDIGRRTDKSPDRTRNRELDRDIGRRTDKSPDRTRNRELDRDIGRRTDKNHERTRNRELDSYIDSRTDRSPDRTRNRELDRYIGRETDRSSNRITNRMLNKYKEKHSDYDKDRMMRHNESSPFHQNSQMNPPLAYNAPHNIVSPLSFGGYTNPCQYPMDPYIAPYSNSSNMMANTSQPNMGNMGMGVQSTSIYWGSMGANEGWAAGNPGYQHWPGHC